MVGEAALRYMFGEGDGSLYLFEADGTPVKTRMRYRVSWGSSASESGSETAGEEEEEEAAYVAAYREALAADDRAIMAELGLSEAEFREVLSDTDSFGTARSRLSSSSSSSVEEEEEMTAREVGDANWDALMAELDADETTTTTTLAEEDDTAVADEDTDAAVGRETDSAPAPAEDVGMEAEEPTASRKRRFRGLARRVVEKVRRALGKVKMVSR